LTFTQEDPIGLAGGLNLYGFANGDPVNFRDPFGLSSDSARGPEVAKTTVLTGGGSTPSSITVSAEYAPLTQGQADDVTNEVARRQRINDAAGGLAVAAIAGLRVSATAATVVAFLVGAQMIATSDVEYIANVGDEITKTVTSFYGSGISSTSVTVRRQNGSVLTYDHIPW
jgi:hypothetical protein